MATPANQAQGLRGSSPRRHLSPGPFDLPWSLWRTMARAPKAALILVLALGLPAGAGAQVPDTTLGDTLLAYLEVQPHQRDSVIVSLRRHGQYRVLLSRSHLTASAIPLKRASPALLVNVTPQGPVSYTILEVYPYTTAPHVLFTAASGDTVRIWLWADRAEERRSAEARDREWGIGLLVGAGYHSGYRIRPADPTPAAASADFETGLLFGSSGRLSGLLGVTMQPRYSGAESVLWVFAEPRMRILRHRPIGLDLALRIGQGAASNSANDPSLIGLGLALAYSLDDRPGARGWRAGLHLMYGWLGNVGESNDSKMLRAGVTLSWLP